MIIIMIIFTQRCEARKVSLIAYGKLIVLSPTSNVLSKGFIKEQTYPPIAIKEMIKESIKYDIIAVLFSVMFQKSIDCQ